MIALMIGIGANLFWWAKHGIMYEEIIMFKDRDAYGLAFCSWLLVVIPAIIELIQYL